MCNLDLAKRPELCDPKVSKDKSSYIKAGEFSDVSSGLLQYTDCQSRKVTKEVAIKVLRGAPAYNKQAIKKLIDNLVRACNEYVLLEDDNVIRFYGVSQGFGYLPALVLERCDKGNVTEYLKGFKDGELKAGTQKRLFKEVTSGLCYLHSRNIVHGDLRAANVLVNKDDRAVIADFGLVFLIDQTEFTSSKIAGSARWSPPEVLDPPEESAGREAQGNVDGDPICTPPYSKKSDIYSLAMVFYEICTGERPFFERRNDSAVIFRIVKGERPPMPLLLESHSRVKDIVTVCWNADPAIRPTAAKVKETLLEEFPAPQENKWNWWFPWRKFFDYIGWTQTP